MPKLENLREIARRETLGEVALPQEVTTFLETTALPVFQKRKPRQVLCANLLKDGEVGPLVALRQGEQPVIRRWIGTSRGWLLVSDRVWVEGLEGFVESCGLTLVQILQDSGEKRHFKIVSDGTGLPRDREERLVPAPLKNRNDIVFIVVREFDPETNELSLLGLEIGTKLKLNLSEWQEVRNAVG